MNLRTIVSQLFASYPNVTINDLTIAAYLDWLKRIPPKDIEATIAQVMIDSPVFLPPAPQLFATWQRLAQPDIPTAAEGWASVSKALKEVGSWGTPNFTNPITAQVVKAIGWKTLCASEDEMADRAHFLKMYDSIAKRQTDTMRQLPETQRMIANHQELREITGMIAQARQITQREREVA